MSEQRSQKIWIIRVRDGENFIKSKYPFWGVISKFKGSVKKFKKGDILCFLTSKKYGAKIIGMAEYTEFSIREDGKLISIYTYVNTNKEQGWTGEREWDIEIHYKNLYITPDKTYIGGIIKGQCVIFDYDKPKTKEQISGDLYEHYKNFLLYAEPKKFIEI